MREFLEHEEEQRNREEEWRQNGWRTNENAQTNDTSESSNQDNQLNSGPTPSYATVISFDAESLYSSMSTNSPIEEQNSETASTYGEWDLLPHP